MNNSDVLLSFQCRTLRDSNAHLDLWHPIHPNALSNCCLAFWKRETYAILIESHSTNAFIILRGYTMGGSDNPTVRYQCTSTAELFRQKTCFDESHLPGMSSKARWMAAHNTIRSCVQFTTSWRHGRKKILIRKNILNVKFLRKAFLWKGDRRALQNM